MKSLSESIDSLYAAFQEVPKPRRIEGCSCCIDESEIRILLSKPLRELTGAELMRYASSAFLTVGQVSDYMYFLPRIVEIGCTDGGWPYLEDTGRAIAETQPTQWPEHRRHALHEVLQSALQVAIDDGEGGTIDELIRAVAKAGLPTNPYLSMVKHSPGAVLAYYERNSESLMKQKLGSAFGHPGDSGYDEIIQWFRSPTISQIILDNYGLTLPETQVQERSATE